MATFLFPGTISISNANVWYYNDYTGAYEQLLTDGFYTFAFPAQDISQYFLYLFDIYDTYGKKVSIGAQIGTLALQLSTPPRAARLVLSSYGPHEADYVFADLLFYTSAAAYVSPE